MTFVSTMNFEQTVNEEDRLAFTFDSPVLSGTVDIASDSVTTFIENQEGPLQVEVGQQNGETTLHLKYSEESIFKGTLRELTIKLQASDALDALRNYFNLTTGKALNNL